ncbi:MAG TPA: hypothetical protein DEP87_02795, partial [Candidatus Pacebacteria bacterium]|nr:hypothetical protein [Candidatus Paceibacterota bacterium]
MSVQQLTLAEQFQQFRQQRTAVIGLLFLLVIVVFWIALGLFSSQNKFKVSKTLRDLAKPLSPSLDEVTLTSLEQKRVFTSSELSSFTIYKLIVSEISKQINLVDINYQEVVKTSSSSTQKASEGIATPTSTSTSTVAVPTSSISTPTITPTTEAPVPTVPS